MKKILSILETAYRGTVEEQDDTILWLNHAIKNSGGEISILLLGNSVNYAVKSQSIRMLSMADSIHMRPPEVDQDLAKMIGKGIPVYIAEEDLHARGLVEAEFIPGVEKVSRVALPALFKNYDQIWYW
jgi:sulfur relay (sulfurtransferase) DsrF/TusC family protein